MTDPVAEYDHTNVVSNPPTEIGNRAITTGEVARGVSISGLEGKLLLGDFPTGLIFLLDVDNDPLDGGQDGLSELSLLNDQDRPVSFLELINQTRAERGLEETSRTDLRFSVNTPGRIFLSNKHDGVIRLLKQDENPSIAIRRSNGQIKVDFKGILESSINLETWDVITPQPVSPWSPDSAIKTQFIRSRILP